MPADTSIECPRCADFVSVVTRGVCQKCASEIENLRARKKTVSERSAAKSNAVDDFAFDDHSAPVPTVSPVQDDHDPDIEEIADALQFNGIESETANKLANSPEIDEAVEKIFQRRSGSIVLAFLRRFATELQDSPLDRTLPGCALIRVLSRDKSRTLRAEAARLGCSAPAICQHEKIYETILDNLTSFTSEN
jgi:hypothetical protein